ncbi:MAG: hypothetical protein ACI8UR_000198 [Natronomonas sp.]|jgi:hypothetical protein|uniref:hypothetical protein n=1 Tax=Natronomonas sp. TaxID=2184060 RepID=UPI0039E47C50
MRRSDLRPSTEYRPDERPPPGVVTVVTIACLAALALSALSPYAVMATLVATTAYSVT